MSEMRDMREMRDLGEMRETRGHTRARLDGADGRGGLDGMDGRALSETTAYERRTPSHGQAAIVLAGLTIGTILMGIQLWLLTVALDLYLSGRPEATWLAAGISGLVFLGGLLILRLLPRRPKRPW
jgi:uncharacterized protein DUF6755